jgi:hypothetical protein
MGGPLRTARTQIFAVTLSRVKAESLEGHSYQAAEAFAPGGSYGRHFGHSLSPIPRDNTFEPELLAAALTIWRWGRHLELSNRPPVTPAGIALRRSIDRRSPTRNFALPWKKPK